jgi:hypothetical protein
MKRTHLLPAILLLCLQACVALDQVRTFSKYACGILISINDLDYSFKGSYLKYTLPGKEFQFEKSDPLIKPTADTAELRRASDADATIALFTNCLSAYFAGLGQLADPATGATDYSKLGDALKGNAPVMARLHLDAGQVEAAVSLAHVFTDALTRHYKEQQLKEIILADSAAVRKVIDALSTSLGILQDNIVSDQGILFAKYHPLMKLQIDAGVKIFFVREYHTEYSVLEQKLHAITSQRQGLEALKKAHQEIADKLKDNKLSAAELVKSVEQYSAQLQTIYNDIKKVSK